MIGVFIDGVRIGSVMHFTDNGKHRFWTAWSYGDVSQQFNTRKAAVAWLTERHKQGEVA